MFSVLCVWMCSLHICAQCVYSAYMVQERTFILELELGQLTGWCGSQTWFLWKSSQCSYLLSHLSSPEKFLYDVLVNTYFICIYIWDHENYQVKRGKVAQSQVILSCSTVPWTLWHSSTWYDLSCKQKPQQGTGALPESQKAAVWLSYKPQ